jgi:hypothetical protein
MNISDCLILTTQDLYNNTLLLTNIKPSSHFEGVQMKAVAALRMVTGKIKFEYKREGSFYAPYK